MNIPKIFWKYAQIYDLIYSGKNYEEESKRITRIIKRYKKSDGKELLEVACGTGNYLKFFKNDFNCIGLDISEKMLRIARKKLSKIKFVKGNMVNFKLNKKFDVILCLFNSIGYAKTYKNLEKTIRNFSSHLKNGGILIINPWFSKSDFKPKTNVGLYENEKIKIARIYVTQKIKETSILNLHFLIAEKGKVKYLTDRHKLGLFEYSKFLKIMKKNGLNSEFVKIGVKKQAKKKYLSDVIKNHFFVGVKN